MPTEALYQWDSQAAADAEEMHLRAALQDFEHFNLDDFAEAASNDL